MSSPARRRPQDATLGHQAADGFAVYLAGGEGLEGKRHPLEMLTQAARVGATTGRAALAEAEPAAEAAAEEEELLLGCI